MVRIVLQGEAPVDNTVLNLSPEDLLLKLRLMKCQKTSVVLVCELCKIVFALFCTFSGRHDLTEGRGSKFSRCEQLPRR